MPDRASHEQWKRTWSGFIGDAALRAEWAAGTRMTEEQAIACALAERAAASPSPPPSTGDQACRAERREVS